MITTAAARAGAGQDHVVRAPVAERRWSARGRPRRRSPRRRPRQRPPRPSGRRASCPRPSGRTTSGCSSPVSASPRTTPTVMNTASTAPRKRVANIARPNTVEPTSVCSSSRSPPIRLLIRDLVERELDPDPEEDEEDQREREDDGEHLAPQALGEGEADHRARGVVARSGTCRAHAGSSPDRLEVDVLERARQHAHAVDRLARGDQLGDDPRRVLAARRPRAASCPPRSRSRSRAAGRARPASRARRPRRGRGSPPGRRPARPRPAGASSAGPRSRASAPRRAARGRPAARPGRARWWARRAAAGAARRPAPGRSRAAAASPSTSPTTRRVEASPQADQLEQLGALGGLAPRAGEPLMQAQHLLGARPGREAEELGEVADRRARRQRARRVADHPRLAAAGPDEPAGDLGQRRLAGAVRAEQRRRSRPPRPRARPRAAPRSRRSACASPRRRKPLPRRRG